MATAFAKRILFLSAELRRRGDTFTERYNRTLAQFLGGTGPTASKAGGYLILHTSGPLAGKSFRSMAVSFNFIVSSVVRAAYWAFL